MAAAALFTTCAIGIATVWIWLWENVFPALIVWIIGLLHRLDLID
jgi:hypothetical protein